MDLVLINRGSEGEVMMNGQLDSETSEEVGVILEQLLERFDLLILNMENTRYVSSAGLRILKKSYIHMIKKGGSMLLRNVPSRVMEVFEITGFSGFFQFDERR